MTLFFFKTCLTQQMGCLQSSAFLEELASTMVPHTWSSDVSDKSSSQPKFVLPIIYFHLLWWMHSFNIQMLFGYSTIQWFFISSLPFHYITWNYNDLTAKKLFIYYLFFLHFDPQIFESQNWIDPTMSRHSQCLWHRHVEFQNWWRALASQNQSNDCCQHCGF